MNVNEDIDGDEDGKKGGGRRKSENLRSNSIGGKEDATGVVTPTSH